VIRFFIVRLAFSPVAGTDYPHFAATNGEPNRQDSVSDLSESEVSAFRRAVFEIFRQYEWGSAKAVAARSKETPCFARFSRSFVSFHSNSTAAW
jgi:hypothetical protein